MLWFQFITGSTTSQQTVDQKKKGTLYSLTLRTHKPNSDRTHKLNSDRELHKTNSASSQNTFNPLTVVAVEINLF